MLHSYVDTGPTITSITRKLVSSTSVTTAYKGNVDESNASCPSLVNDSGIIKYPGLQQAEQDSFNKGQENKYYRTKNAQNILSNPWPAYSQFKPSYWAGIDCSGFAQRSVEAANNMWETMLSLRVTIPSFKEEQTAAGIDAKAIKSDDFDCDGTVTSGRCVESWTNATPTTPVYVTKEKARAYVIDKINVDLILKGDVIRYPNHVALVHSDKPSTCTNSSGATACTYEIIHASGTDELCYQPAGSTQSNCDFNRKVVRNLINSELQSNTLRNPTGFGRIMLWD